MIGGNEYPCAGKNQGAIREERGGPVRIETVRQGSRVAITGPFNGIHAPSLPRPMMASDGVDQGFSPSSNTTGMGREVMS